MISNKYNLKYINSKKVVGEKKHNETLRIRNAGLLSYIQKCNLYCFIEKYFIKNLN